MKTGMLWFDGSNKSPDEKIREAVKYYEKKFGIKANQVFVHSTLRGEGQVDEVTVTVSAQVLPNHVWVGVK